MYLLYGLRILGMYSDAMAVLDALVEQETDPGRLVLARLFLAPPGT